MKKRENNKKEAMSSINLKNGEKWLFGSDENLYVEGNAVYALRQFIFRTLGLMLVSDYSPLFNAQRDGGGRQSGRINTIELMRELGGERAMILDLISITLVDLVTSDQSFKNAGVNRTKPYQVRLEAWQCLFGEGAEYLRFLSEDILGLSFDVVQDYARALLSMFLSRVARMRHHQERRGVYALRHEIKLESIKGLKPDCDGGKSGKKRKQRNKKRSHKTDRVRAPDVFISDLTACDKSQAVTQMTLWAHEQKEGATYEKSF